MSIDTWIQLNKLKEVLYQDTLSIHNQIDALEKRFNVLEKEVIQDIQKHVESLERRVQLLEKK